MDKLKISLFYRALWSTLSSKVVTFVMLSFPDPSEIPELDTLGLRLWDKPHRHADLQGTGPPVVCEQIWFVILLDCNSANKSNDFPP